VAVNLYSRPTFDVQLLLGSRYYKCCSVCKPGFCH